MRAEPANHTTPEDALFLPLAPAQSSYISRSDPDACESDSFAFTAVLAHSDVLPLLLLPRQVYDFDNIAPWKAAKAEGPANKAPADIRALRANLLRAEWLDLSEPAEDIYVKNHMVFSALLETPTVIGDRTYFAARLSMEVNDKADANYKIPDVNDASRFLDMSDIF